MSNLLPPNATAQERALDETTARISDVPVMARDVWDVEQIPANLLPWLAWAYSVDDWSPDWSDTQKRQAIAKSIDVHRYKGTIGAVREALAALGIEISIIEWFNKSPVGVPYTFDIDINVESAPADQGAITKVLDVIGATKNLRSHLGTATIGATSNTTLYCATVTGTGLEIEIEWSGWSLYAGGMAISDGNQRANGILNPT